MEVTVVTNVDMGWDCVVGVYESDEYAKMKHKGESYVFTCETINTRTIKIVKPDDNASIITYDEDKHAITLDGGFQTSLNCSSEDRINDPELMYTMALEHQKVLKTFKSSRGYVHDIVWDDQCNYYHYAITNVAYNNVDYLSDEYDLECDEITKHMANHNMYFY